MSLADVKTGQRDAWATGDYQRIGNTLVPAAELLCESVDVRAGQRVLDVATGTGNAALAAARRWCRVTGVDFVPALLDRARQRAAAEGLPAAFEPGDAEALPYPDGSFDVVLSTFGVMFAPDQRAAAAELLRVCRPGGRIGLANWTPGGYSGRLFATVARHLPPPTGTADPTRWGTEEGVRALLGGGAASLTAQRREIVFRYPSPAHYVDHLRTYFGPLATAFDALDAAGRAALADELTALVERCNVSADDTVVLPAEYLEVVARRG